MEALTSRQKQILEFVQRTIQTEGAAPAVREIGAHFGMKSPNGVFKHLKALKAKGYLEGSESTHRGLNLPNWKPSALIPLLGQVQAGLPVLAEQHIDSYLSVDRDLVRGGGKLFALVVKGDSMKDAGIYEGDKVVVRQQE